MVWAIPFGKASENMGCVLIRCTFSIFLVCSADLDILCSEQSRSPSTDRKFYRYMFVDEILSWVVGANGKHLGIIIFLNLTFA